MADKVAAPIDNAKRFYMVAQLLKLRPLYQDVSKNLARYKKLWQMEQSGVLYENGHKAEFDECIELEKMFSKLEADYNAWKKQTTDFLKMPAEDIKDALGLIAKKKKNKEIDEKLPFPEQIKLQMDDVLGPDLWHGGTEANNLAGLYLRSLTRYICAPAAAQSEDFDGYVIESIGNINSILPRGYEYPQAQAVLQEMVNKKIKEKIKDKSVFEATRRAVYGKYWKQEIMRQASTKTADNAFFRCMAAGRFYIPEDECKYSAYFVKHFGQRCNLSPNVRGREMEAGTFLNANDMLKLAAQTYDDKTAEAISRELCSKGIGRADLEHLNGYDLCKLLQSEREAQNGTNYGRSIRQICQNAPDAPYQRCAQMLGMMLTLGQKYVEEKAKCGDDAQALAWQMSLVTVRVGTCKMPETIYREHFSKLYENQESFLKACGTAYSRLSKDFAKNEMSDYLERWIPQLCEGRFDLPPNQDSKLRKPFEINIHHKLPIKVAKDLENPADINDVRNFCLFIEFKDPGVGKLTKHLQEHNKESAGMAVVGKDSDMRFVVTSENTVLAHDKGEEPLSFAHLRQSQIQNQDKSQSVPSRMAVCTGKGAAGR